LLLQLLLPLLMISSSTWNNESWKKRELKLQLDSSPPIGLLLLLLHPLTTDFDLHAHTHTKSPQHHAPAVIVPSQIGDETGHKQSV
jgi:hypothetical protein